MLPKKHVTNKSFIHNYHNMSLSNTAHTNRKQQHNKIQKSNKQYNV